MPSSTGNGSHPAEPPQAGPPDSVDRLLAGWARVQPDLDFAPVGIVQRLGKVRRYLDAEIEAGFTEFGLNGPDYIALATLRLHEHAGGVSQRYLMRELGLTSGTISVRVDRLVDQGLVTRTPDPGDRRNSLVALTDSGRDRLDRVTPAHLDLEDRMLSALGPEERATLRALLHRLLVSFEGSAPDAESPSLGMTLAPAHLSVTMRQAVGLPPVTGLLVREVTPDSPADKAGIKTGDVLTQVNARNLRAITTLHTALSSADTLTITLTRGVDDHHTITIDPDSPDSAKSAAADPRPGSHLI
ncbi:MarR family transcriptional regulator [Nocardia sp. NPDC058058]|uniref:MarR family transcriptional regulator n=1 Tax=Nocardia sp. NPDC058058 TaxID=3346317 RepID=UPI0036DB7F45